MSAKQRDDARGQWETQTGSVIVWQHLGESTETWHRGAVRLAAIKSFSLGCIFFGGRGIK